MASVSEAPRSTCPSARAAATRGSDLPLQREFLAKNRALYLLGINEVCCTHGSFTRHLQMGYA